MRIVDRVSRRDYPGESTVTVTYTVDSETKERTAIVRVPDAFCESAAEASDFAIDALYHEHNANEIVVLSEDLDLQC